MAHQNGGDAEDAPQIAVLYGTRPEAIKLGPVVGALRVLGHEPRLFCTGQHTDLLQGTPAETDLGGAVSLGLPSGGDIATWIDWALPAAREALRGGGYRLVLVQGDTMSAFVGAAAAKDLGVPVGHIEAGLRSGTLQEPWPEEWFRRVISRVATWHFAPTGQAAKHLAAERIPNERIFVTGNPVVSAIARYTQQVPVAAPVPRILITLHRREWLAQGVPHVEGVMQQVLDFARSHPDLEFCWPVHPHVRQIAGRVFRKAARNVQTPTPLGYVAMIRLLAGSLGVATDSGGLQEEAATLGVPCAVLRNVTDRPESVEAGIAALFRPTPEGVWQALEALTRQELPRCPLPLYGTPQSAARIAGHVATIVHATPEHPPIRAFDAPSSVFPA